MIRIYCSKADATLQETETLTAGMVNTPVVQFTFSSDWNGLGKSAIVRAGTVIKEVVVSNNQIVVPSECLAKAGVNLIIGVWGGNFTTELPTVWCACGEIQDATNPNSALNHEDATASNVAQMLASAERAEAALDRIENANWDDVAQKVGQEKVNKPFNDPNGTSGQILQTNGDGTTEWIDRALPTDEQVGAAVDSWLDEHPEATTTVEDGSLVFKQFNDDLKTMVGYKSYAAETAWVKRRESFFGNYRTSAITYDTTNDSFYIVGGATNHDGTTKIAKISDIFRPTTDNSNVINAGHANDITYDPINNRLVICCGSNVNPSYAAEYALGTTMIFVDPDTLQIIGSKDLGIFVNGVEYVNGYFYVLGAGTSDNGFYKYSLDFETQIQRHLFSKADILAYAKLKESEAVQQTLSLNDGRLCFDCSLKADQVDQNRDSELPTYYTHFMMIEIDMDELTPTGEIITVPVDFPIEEPQSSVCVDGCNYLLSDGLLSSVKEFRASIPDMSVFRRSIPRNSDLNNYTAPGHYFVSNGSKAGTIANSPWTTGGFSLIVFPTGSYQICQLLFPNNRNGIYQRRLAVDGNVWQPWEKLATSNDVATEIIADGYYQSGDTVSYRGIALGFLTSSQKRAKFFLPTSKRTDNITSASISNVVGAIRTATGGYINGYGETHNWSTDENVRVYINSIIASSEGIYLWMDFTEVPVSKAYEGASSSSSVTNNSILLFDFNATITFG